MDGRALTLDRDVEARPGDRLLVNLPNGKAEARSAYEKARAAMPQEAGLGMLQIKLDDLADGEA